MRGVLITGAASGIGAATAQRFKQDGDKVAGLDIDRASLEEVDLDVRVVADVADETAIERAVQEAADTLGRLDVVVGCAGIGRRGTVADTELDDWERVFAVNVRGLYLTARAAIPLLREAGGGVIVNVASQLGLVAAPNAAAYCASKGAVVQLTKAMAIDHTSEGIRVNAVCPGPTRTPMVHRYFEASEDPSAEQRRYEGMQLHDRMLDPEEIADAIAYLASPGASSTLGTCLVVDGGYSIS